MYVLIVPGRCFTYDVIQDYDYRYVVVQYNTYNTAAVACICAKF